MRISAVQGSERIRDPSAFDAIGGSLTLDFVNTIANRANPGKRADLLVHPSDLQRWFAAVGLPAGEFHPSDLEEVRAIRERLHQVFWPVTQGIRVDDPTLDAFVRDLLAATSKRRLRVFDERITWDWVADVSVVHKFLFPVLEDAAGLLVSGELQKVRQCQGPGCGWLFIDRSRGRPRRWCSMSDCGNKAKARRHYLRQTEG
jgi:predicted RNA-binding Zn ribbon-like protein